MNFLQFLFEGVSFATKAIFSNKTRSILTMLGVATGIFVLISILTMVNSLKTSITDNLSSLGNTTLFVHNWPWADSHNEWYKYFNRPKASYKDFQRLQQELPSDKVEAIYYQVMVGRQTVKGQGRSISGIRVGSVTSGVGIVRDFDFSEGRFFSDIEFNSQIPVCIIGHTVAENIFIDGNAIGKYIQIRNKRLRVIGVLEKMGGSMFGKEGDDEMVYVSYLCGARMYNFNRRSVDKLIAVKIVNLDEMEYMESEITGVVRASRGLKPAVEDNFSINKQESVIKRLDEVFGFMEKGGWAISIFSILIGGFSIGLIMYISVRERTNEIGIQKALGATRNFILYQFLAEAAIICLLGGLIGLIGVVVLTSAVQYLVEQFGVSMNIGLSSREISIGLGLATSCGLVAGFVPALIAALIDPVIAIRHS